MLYQQHLALGSGMRQRREGSCSTMDLTSRASRFLLILYVLSIFSLHHHHFSLPFEYKGRMIIRSKLKLEEVAGVTCRGKRHHTTLDFLPVCVRRASHSVAWNDHKKGIKANHKAGSCWKESTRNGSRDSKWFPNGFQMESL